MYIEFQELTYRNLMATGNAPITIQLNKTKTSLIIGKNGAGKSSGILDGLFFALFGTPFRDIKKAQLINSINRKQCVVEVTFKIGQITYRVSRGIKPDVFEIYRNGELIPPVASAREYQKMLEEQILNMTPKTFKQIVLLSVANFKPFMQLTAAERRDVIEDILDIKIFSAMNSKLKERISVLKENVSVIDGQIEIAKQKVELQKQYVATLKEAQETKLTELEQSISNTNAVIVGLEELLQSHQEKITPLQEQAGDYHSLVDKQYKFNGMIAQLNSKISQLNETIQFYEQSDNCPTCLQTIAQETKEQHITKSTTKIDEINKAIEQLQQKLSGLEEEINQTLQINDEINKEQAAIRQVNSQIIAEQNFVRKLNAELITAKNNSSGSLDQEEVKVKQLAEAALNLIKQKSSYSEQKIYYDIAVSLLKDSGIKTKIIEQYLPVVNTLINKYLAEMDVWISFHLDSEFNETIKSRHRDTFTYYSFSEGEKQRIDLAILFAWRTVAKMRNSVNCSLVVFDEIMDKALDHEGVHHVAKLLNTLGDGSNAFIISHKVELLMDKFDRTLEFEKVGNFSTMNEIMNKL